MSNNTGGGKQGLLVVVWEYQNKQGRWRPYSPEVTQHLERAYAKKLRSVKLGDANPDLEGLYVNLSSLKQQDDSGLARNVRRSLYPQSSTAGQGAVWQWEADTPGYWHSYDMPVQFVLEDSWASGVQKIDMDKMFPQCHYIMNFSDLTQKNKKTGGTRSIRRSPQAAYPIGRPETPQQNNETSNQRYIMTTKKPNFQQEASNEPTKGKRRGSKEEFENKVKGEGAARGFLNKVGDLLHLSSSGSNEVNNNNKGANSTGNATIKNSKSNKNHPPSKITSSPPSREFRKPPELLPRTKQPPIPKPRTLFPVSQVEILKLQEQYKRMEDPKGFHERMDSNEDKFGSSATLNFEGGLGMRRPSIETISTYLSQESFNEESNSQISQNLIQLNDSLSEDEALSADQEVRQLIMKSNSLANEVTDSSESYFVPISSPSHKDSDPSNNRKRIRERISSPMSPSFNRTANMDSHPSNMMEVSSSSSNYFNKRTPKTDSERLLLKYTKPVIQVQDRQVDCPICLCGIDEDSSYDQASAGFLSSPIVALLNCQHLFHEDCLIELIKSSPGECVRCPTCKTIHGTKIGIQPPGNMRISANHRSLPGYEGFGTIQITYIIPPGIQTHEHPNPGRPYHPIGFPRSAYLPDIPKGRKVLKLLEEAFRRRLIFTIGTSVTIGCEDAVTWNEIHHKTSINNYNGHGYPDPNYLDNVLAELEAQGVVE